MPRSERALKMLRQETGIGRWQKALGRHVWFLRRAGIPSDQIVREVARSLRQLINSRAFPVPEVEDQIYTRILARWQHQKAYLGKGRQPRALRFQGRFPTFRSLVRAVAPQADASKILGELKRSGQISQSSDGLIRVLVKEFSGSAAQDASLLSSTLASLDALTDTCYANLRDDRSAKRLSPIQGMVYSDHLNRRQLRAYEEFMAESGQVFLAMHEAWLRRHEVQGVGPRQPPGRRVGVGVFAVRSR